MLYSQAVFRTAGDRSIVMEFANAIDPYVLSKIRSMAAAVEDQPDLFIEEILPTYCSLQFFFSPLLTTPDVLRNKLREIEKSLPPSPSVHHRRVEIPILYGGDAGADLPFVAKHNGLSQKEVIDIHSHGDYLVYMLGFTPGFAYMGGMDKRISTPRLMQPRIKIPAGSCGIAGDQTGIYPIDSPGGGQLIGKTPLKLFDPFSDHPVLLQAGDKICFVPIDEDEFHHIIHLTEAGIYIPSISEEQTP